MNFKRDQSTNESLDIGCQEMKLDKFENIVKIKIL